VRHLFLLQKSNTAEIYKKFTEEYMQLKLEEEGLNMNASFEHLGMIL
jgi:hypothetical protein